MKEFTKKKKIAVLLLGIIVSIGCWVFVLINGALHGDVREVILVYNMPISFNSINGMFQTFSFMMAMMMPCIESKWGTRLGATISGLFTFTTLMRMIVSKSLMQAPGVMNGIFAVGAILIIGSLFRSAEKKMVTDVLTGLFNLRGFFGEMDSLINNKRSFSLAIIQINNFRNINDEYGHAVGDAALKISGERLQGLVGKKGSVSRITGAEFAVIIDKQYDAENVIRDAIKILGERMEISGDKTTVNCYLEAVAGISEYPKDATDRDELIKWADIAQMHAGKSESSVAKFDDDMYSDLLHREEVEQLIKEALSQDYFYLDYQPQFSVDNKELRGFEALIRMKLDDGRVVSPAEFIPIAELSNLIFQIDEYAVERVLKEFSSYVKKDGKSITVSVNISANGFAREEFVPFVKKMLEKYSFPSECLEIEITEYSFAVSQEMTLRNVNELKQMNVQIALDDFGTGYTSLSQLMNLSANLLKVDKSLVDDIAKSELNSDFVKAIVSMGHLLNCDVVLEGVESNDQVDTIKTLDGDYIQGYVWSKPINYNDALKLIE